VGLEKQLSKELGNLFHSPQNIAKAFDVQQRKNGGPADFFHRLIDQMRRYSGLNIDDPLGQGMLKLHFVTNSWLDIAKKLQKHGKLERQEFSCIIKRSTKGLCKTG
jgi:hypothetical protein